MKSFLFDKSRIFPQTSIEKSNKIISDDLGLSEEFSTFFNYAVRSLNVNPDEYYLSDTGNLSGPVEIAIKRFEDHSSVLAIMRSISVNQNFHCSNTDVSDTLKQLQL